MLVKKFKFWTIAIFWNKVIATTSEVLESFGKPVCPLFLRFRSKTQKNKFNFTFFKLWKMTTLAVHRMEQGHGRVCHNHIDSVHVTLNSQHSLCMITYNDYDKVYTYPAPSVALASVQNQPKVPRMKNTFYFHFGSLCFKLQTRHKV